MFMYKFKWESLSDSLFVDNNGLFPCMTTPNVIRSHRFRFLLILSEVEFFQLEFSSRRILI